MATTKYRINISLPEEVEEALVKLAKRDQMPTATKAKDLLEIALELEEDQVWNDIASHRDKMNAKFLSHSEAFGS
jgi:hypothetical protein